MYKRKALPRFEIVEGCVNLIEEGARDYSQRVVYEVHFSKEEWFGFCPEQLVYGTTHATWKGAVR